jgi:glutamate formiminotransferase/formiminotetrahydrofolate cyclodeaminase
VKRLVECVPNFSEGRRREVIEAILAAVRSVEGVIVLDHHSDVDHNRTVVTFVGPPEAALEAAYAAIAKAAQLIDLDHHRGEHPRIGATDVVPFVPLEGVTMEDCVALARQLGERVGKELGIPVYLYEAAATRPDRENLENIRRGEYEGLKAEIATNPDRAPDFGPARLGPAGATVIGARPFLIAYNVYLTTSDVEIAKKIAKAIRFSSGGLRYVKALGLLVEGRAQVSINMTDFRKTPIYRVVELIRREAQRYGVGIAYSELVGLAPQAALLDAAQWYLQLDKFEPGQILENRLAEVQAAEAQAASIADFVDSVAAPTATPGGGAVAALAGALAAALAQMVAGLTVGKKKYAEAEAEMQRVLTQAQALRRELLDAVAEDSAAFEAVMAAYRLPQGTEEEKARREATLQRALAEAATVPLRVARASVRVLELAQAVAERGNTNTLTDAGSAAHMARAAMECAGLNVRANAANMTDQETARAWLDELADLRRRAAELEVATVKAVVKRGNLPV